MQIKEFIQAFESGELHHSVWDHPAHLRVALYYIFHESDFYCALIKIRCGIIRYNKSAEDQKHREGNTDALDKTCTTGYHETITRFWATQIKAFVDARSNLSIEELEQQLFASELSNGRYILQFYTTHEIRSVRYRAEYVPYQRSGL